MSGLVGGRRPSKVIVVFPAGLAIRSGINAVDIPRMSFSGVGDRDDGILEKGFGGVEKAGEANLVGNETTEMKSS